MSKISIIEKEWYGRLPTVRLCDSIRDYFLNSDKLNLAFRGEINSYHKDDYLPRNLPAMNIHPVRTELRGKYWYHVDTVYLDIYIPVSAKRDFTQTVALVLSQAIELQLLSPSFMEFIANNNPGVFDFGASTEGYSIDYSRLIKETNKDVTLIRFEFIAKLDWLAYNQWLLEQGLNPIDPSEVIFDTLQSLTMQPSPFI
jgi:hypothetical protein